MTDSLGRILIVDDEKAVLDVLGEYFATQGYAVETASSGEQALEAAMRERPDLVLLDVRMPGIDGMEVLRRLRDHDESLAVIMVTANEDVGLARETLKLGAFDYVAKPFDFRYLDRAVAAGLVQGGARPSAPAATDGDDPWKRLALAVFRAARGMSATGRASTGERLESAVLDAMREVGAGRPHAASHRLADVERLLGIATELGDLPAASRTAIETAIAAARKAAGTG